MSELIERVANAIYDAIEQTALDANCLALQGGRIYFDGDFDAKAVARVAILAMLDPPDDVLLALQAAAGAQPGTVFMADAVGPWVWGCGIAAALGKPLPPPTGRIYSPAPIPPSCRAMIDVALEEKGGS